MLGMTYAPEDLRPPVESRPPMAQPNFNGASLIVIVSGPTREGLPYDLLPDANKELLKFS